MKERHDCQKQLKAASKDAGKKDLAGLQPPSSLQKEERMKRCVRCRACSPGNLLDGGTVLVAVHDAMTCNQYCSEQGYCGAGDLYKTGRFTPCTDCADEDIALHLEDRQAAQKVNVTAAFPHKMIIVCTRPPISCYMMRLPQPRSHPWFSRAME